MPGASIDSVDGDDFTGTVKVKLGPINLTYKGNAKFVEKDDAAKRAVIDARGKDARGNGTAAAVVTATLSETDGLTSVQVDTELDITGKPAQFGRGVMVDVGNKLIGQFAERLAATIRGDAAPESPAPARRTKPAHAAPDPEPAEPIMADPPATEAAQDAPTEVIPVNGYEPPASAGSQAEVEPINLLEHAGPAIAKRLAPVALALVIVLGAWRRRRRARAHR
jgi:carbon monoxide dehydrogenase subunit G